MVLVGGGTLMPSVQDFVSRLTGIPLEVPSPTLLDAELLLLGAHALLVTPQPGAQYPHVQIYQIISAKEPSPYLRLRRWAPRNP